MLIPESIDDVVLVTHRGCLDGAGCAIMFLAAGGDKENIRYIPPGQTERFVKDGLRPEKFYVFADVGLNRPEYADILEKSGNCVILDHHKTSLHLKDREWCWIDMDICGSILAYDYFAYCGFYPWLTVVGTKDDKVLDGQTGGMDAYFSLAEIIDDFDRFLLKDNRSIDLANLMSFYGQEKFVDEFQHAELRFVDEQFWTNFELELLPILKERERLSIATSLKRVRKRNVTLENYYSFPVKMAYVVSSEPYVSNILAAILSSNPDCQVAVMVNLDRGSVSLRSRGDVDVAEIASVFKGGGHRPAAGHGLPPGLIDEIVDQIHGGEEVD